MSATDAPDVIRIGGVCFRRDRPLDGAMGSELLARVASDGPVPPAHHRERPAEAEAVHRAYRSAGAQWLATDTFLVAGSADAVADTQAAVGLARAAADGGLPVALSLGPGPAPGAYAEAARAAADAGADLVLLETFTSARAAAAAARAVGGCGLPVVVLLVFDDLGLTLTGREPVEAGVSLLVEAGADGVGTNCQPPDVLEKVVPRIAAAAAGTSLPVLVRPSAGIPSRRGESWVYPWAPEPWATATATLQASGATLLGGCCGAGPAHVAALARLLAAARGT